MNQETINIIEKGLQASFTGENSFPEVVKNLINAGIERYYTDLIAFQKTFYATDGSTYTAKLPYSNPPVPGEIFAEKDIAEAIKAIQRGEIIYPEFLNRAIKAGVVSYTVYFLGKQVQYNGAKGEIHTENFPR